MKERCASRQRRSPAQRMSADKKQRSTEGALVREQLETEGLAAAALTKTNATTQLQ